MNPSRDLCNRAQAKGPHSIWTSFLTTSLMFHLARILESPILFRHHAQPRLVMHERNAQSVPEGSVGPWASRMGMSPNRLIF